MTIIYTVQHVGHFGGTFQFQMKEYCLLVTNFYAIKSIPSVPVTFENENEKGI